MTSLRPLWYVPPQQRRLCIMQKMVFPCTLFLAVSLVLAGPARGQAQFFSHPLTTSLRLPFPGTVSVPLPDATTDTVTLSGVLHLVLHVVPPDSTFPVDPMRIGVNLQGVTGVGETGRRYLGVGAEQVNFATLPADP